MATTDGWTRTQRDVVAASFLGWMLDAFDFFLVVFVFSRLAEDFHTTVKSVTYTVFLTLAMRPIGAFLFGRFADRYGRRPALMLSVLLYSVMEMTSALAPTLTAFLVMRALYGIAMGGEWGVGASLAFEIVPIKARGLVSGMLQAGYPCGYLLAAVVFGLLFDHIGWRGMFLVGGLPALLLVVFIYFRVPESTTWVQGRGRPEAQSLWRSLKGHWWLALYGVALMTCFNFFSHGTQDLYPRFLESQHGFSTGTRSIIVIIYNIGAMCGGLLFGTLSSRFGRRRTIALAAILALPTVYFWAFSSTAVALAVAAFVMQFLVQGAWGVVPVHLNELAPSAIRATFPGVVYQLGNLIASYNATLQETIADWHGSVAHPDYAFAFACVCGTVAISLALLAWFGPERRDVRFDTQ